MRRSIYFVAVLIIFAGACSVSEQTITSTRPPDIILSDDIVRLALIDRSKPSSQAVSVLEGVATGELIGADRNGRNEVMTSFHRIMRDQNRFEIVPTDIVLKGSSTGATWSQPLDETVILDISERLGVDAVLALEYFDSDGRNLASTAISFGAMYIGLFDPTTYPMNVRTGWRLYDGLNGQMLDQFESYQGEDGWWSYSIYPDPDQYLKVSEGAQNAAFQYAGRVVPVPIQYVRDYYRCASGAKKDMKQADRMVRAQRWERAEDLWKNVYSSADSDIARGRAAYNLAVAYEKKGDLKGAIQWLERSVDLGNNKAISYSAQITNRLDQQIWYERESQKNTPNSDIPKR